MRIKNHAFLVTGGCSGLGAATAKELISAGAHVVIADVTQNKTLLSELGPNAYFVQTDVSQEADCKAAIAAVKKQYGELHGLINCAGVVVGEKILGKEGLHQLASFNRCIQINLTGSFNMIRFSAEAMSQASAHNERGVIVNTASIAAFEGQIGQVAYAASKGGVVAMTLPLARELARYGIRVMTIAPGVFETPMMQAMSGEIRDSLAKTIPFPQRFGHPQEYAALVKHIIENPMLNGEVIRLDGALRMGAK